ncbi:MAG: caspase family protein [Bacteroidota bacterium]
MPRKLYALLAGINKYPDASHLKGCVNDIQHIKTYLEGREDLELDLRVLTEEAATKQAIIEGFELHLSKAKKDELILFYFAGHGVEENTDIEIFQSDSSTKNLQALLCWNTDTRNPQDPQKTCLADKELRYLIAGLNQEADTYIITDCCHSGGNTRLNGEKRQAQDKSISARSWEGFHFHDKIDQAATQNHSLSELIPRAPHVHLSACRNTEVAWEGKYNEETKGGQFSIALFNLLKNAQKPLSIQQVYDQLLNRMRGLGNKAQSPTLYVKHPDPYKKFSGFLGSEVVPNPHQTQIMYNPSPGRGWILSLGQMHGLDAKAKPLCKVFKDGDAKEGEEVGFKSIAGGYSVLNIPKEWGLNKQERYDCEVHIPVHPMPIFLDLENATELEEKLTEVFSKEESQYISFEAEEELAKYVIRKAADQVIICLPNDQRPLLYPLDIDPKIPYKTLAQQLAHIAQWEFTLNLENPRTQLKKRLPATAKGRPIEMQLFISDEEGEKIPFPVDNPSVEIILDKRNEENIPYQMLGLRFKNHSRQTLYCSLIYMGMNFGAMTQLLAEDCIELRPGDSYDYLEGDMIPLSLSTYILKDNWKASRENLKVMVSTEAFDLNHLGQDALPVPYSDSHRNMGFPSARSGRQKSDWMSYTYEVFLLNPFCEE